jgi:hypothetical protein
VELTPRARKPYQLRYSYTPDQPVAEAAIHSRYTHIDAAARAFIRLSAPYKQVIVEERGELEYLDDLEEARLEEICDRAGFDVEKIEA